MANISFGGYCSDIILDGDGFVGVTSTSTNGTIRRLQSNATAAGGGVTGTGSSTVRRFQGAGTGNDSAIGSGASTLRRFTSGGIGNLQPEGTSAGTIRRVDCEASGSTSVSGTGAGVIRRLTSKNSQRYDITIEGRSLYVGPQRGNFAEVFQLIVFCNFQDSHTFDIYIISDKKRFIAVENYHTNESIVNNQAAAGQIEFRQSIVGTPEEGFVGTFFQYKIVKAVPRDGEFKFYGADIFYIPRIQLGGEFFTKIEDIDNGW